LFPDMVLPLVLSSERDIALMDEAILNNRIVGLVPQLNGDEQEPTREDLHRGGGAGIILKMLKFPDDTTRVLVQGISRIHVKSFIQSEPFFKASIEVLEEILPDKSSQKSEQVRFNALFRSLKARFDKLISLMPNFPEELKVASMNITEPGRLADLIASNINLSMEERCQILDLIDVRKRMEKLSVFLEREMQMVEIGHKIQTDVQAKVGQGQREFFLREQLKSIRHELGEDDESSTDIEELRLQLEQAGLPEEARKEANRELNRLGSMQPNSAEYTVSRTYLDWMATLPWQKKTADVLDIRLAKKIMDSDHYGLEKVKQRIIEYLAVRKINPEGRGPILCFVGPPGVGKTSLGKSIAAALGRKFVRISLGGVRDEAEVRGHRRTYIGALPGRIIQGLRKAGSNNPVFMMDEIDKLASDFRGDPASALLEVLDPEQNNSFSDHYLDVAFDLSNVMFITTANQVDTIPPALHDRMEVLPIPGYSEEEKLQIARHHLVKKVLGAHGLKNSQIRFNLKGLQKIITDYTREAGLRNLEREMSAICRKVAVKIAKGITKPVGIDAAMVQKLLGSPKFHPELANRVKTPGICVGLAWTATGGDVLFIESTRMHGTGKLILTGQIGEVMKESATAALSWIRTHSTELGIKGDGKLFSESDFHIHFPEGAIPKDGPSAGITMIVSLVSLLKQKRVPARLAMTGELTLRGRILPVGGIKEKMLAARRAGIKEVILPKQNESDLAELPKELKEDIVFHPVQSIEDALKIAFPTRKTKVKSKQ
ncbi:MAG: endopeptidase La, partial [Planctomycetes bacterium]|nr:endopeptidase La [Planctomycetota bacterium]